MTPSPIQFIRREESVRDAMASIDRSGQGVVLVVDEHGRLQDTVTDGDMRRAILAGLRLDALVADLVSHKRQSVCDEPPITAPASSTREEMLWIMQTAGIRQLPLVDGDGRVIDLVILDRLLPDQDLPVQAVIMAGGFGTRLRPLTDNVPKPMLHIAGRPLLERTIERLRQTGIRRINITTHYLPEKITDHFGSGSDFGVELNYVSEDQPLGTAGSLALLGEVTEPMLVLNGDILTRVDFRQMLEFHRERKADLTVGVRQFDLQVPYGVIEAENGNVRGVREKPKLDFLVNAGVYLLEPSVRSLLPVGKRCDMTDLITMLVAAKRCVASFPIVEYWLDIGKLDDFQRAQDDFQDVRWAA